MTAPSWFRSGFTPRANRWLSSSSSRAVKDLYAPCLEAFYPKLNPGAVIVADNMLRSGNEDVRRYGRAIRAKPGITSVLLPVGSGLEISRFEPD